MTQLQEFEDNLDFQEDWVNVNDLELKILMLTGLLADSNLAYRGTLTTMCEWLGVKPSAVNNKKIKAAIFNLLEQEYIFCNIEGRDYHISIRQKGLRDKNVIKIRKKWVETFKNYNRDENNQKIDKSISIDWIKVLRVFVFIYGLGSNNLITYSEIAEDLNMSIETIRKALNIIMDCDLENIAISKEIVRDHYTTPQGTVWKTKGTDLAILVKF